MKTPKLIFTLVLGWSCALSALPAFSQESAKERSSPESRLDFFQHNFSKFVPMEFRKGTNSEAAIQILPVNTNLFEFEGEFYCGFKFTVPPWLDGDFEWMYLLTKTGTNKNFNRKAPEWFIIPETGWSPGFHNYNYGSLNEYPGLKKQFPTTARLITQDLDQDRLTPGKTYAIWFGFKQRDLPDIAFAMTIRSERGKKEFGTLPMH